MRVARSLRITILFLAALALPAARAAAQAQQSSDSQDAYGVKAGVLWSSLDLTLPDFIISENQQIGFTAGVFGSTRLPKLARSLGEASKEFKAGTEDPQKTDGEAKTAE